jgi:acetolactate synthase-1/2/3 large subunit
VAKREELDAAITEMFNQDGPFLLDVKVKNEGNVFPMVPAGASVSDIRLE